jgi:2-succinyl-5-enolpyruvyl-6-hydroxy-3-cyclohexene-1-carboxylate synthase
MNPILSAKTVEALMTIQLLFYWNNSNLHHPSFINNIDTIITPFTDEDFKDFCPDVLVTFEEWLFLNVSKLLRNTSKHHWHIDTLRAYDTFGILTKHFEVDICFFLMFSCHLKNQVIILKQN